MLGMKIGFLKSKTPSSPSPGHASNSTAVTPLPEIQKSPSKIAPSALIPATTSKVNIPTGKVPVNERGIPKHVPVPDSFFTQGIAAVTIPAPSFFSFEPTTTCLLYVETRNAIIKTPNFPTSMQFPSTPLPYKIQKAFQDNENGGLGVFAARDIEAGELIMSERPLVILPAMIACVNDPNAETPNQMLQRWTSVMSKSNATKLNDLSNCKGEDSGLTGLLDTNCLYVGRLPGEYEGSYRAVCHHMSRVNHSCSPNASEFWDLKSFSFQLHASRSIAKGSQIFITYMTQFASGVDRRKELKDKYSFVCMCSSCALFDKDKGQVEQSRASDIRRFLLAKHKPDPSDEGELKKWITKSSLSDDKITKESLKWISMMEEEGVFADSIWVTHVQRLVKSYCALEDADNARNWARKAAAWTRALNGTDGGWDAVAQDPEGTDWWGLRPAKT